MLTVRRAAEMRDTVRRRSNPARLRSASAVVAATRLVVDVGAMVTRYARFLGSYSAGFRRRRDRARAAGLAACWFTRAEMEGSHNETCPLHLCNYMRLQLAERDQYVCTCQGAVCSGPHGHTDSHRTPFWSLWHPPIADSSPK